MNKYIRIILPVLIVVTMSFLTACTDRKSETSSAVTKELSSVASTETSTEAATEPSSRNAENTETGVYTKITVEEAYEMMQNQEVVIVDVRTQAEYNTGYIPKAILIPNEEIKDTPPAQLPDKDAIILLYCRSGNRSAQAANKLIKMGYTKVYDFGGINKWPYDIEQP